MSQEKSTLRTVLGGASWYAGSSALIIVVGVLLMPVWTAFLSKEEIGILGTLQAYVALITPIVMLGMHVSIIRSRVDYSAPNDWSDYVSTLFWAALGQSTIVVLLVWAGFHYANIAPLDHEAFMQCLPLVLIGVVIAQPLLVLQTVLRSEESHRSVNLMQLGVNLLGLILGVVAVVYLHLGIYGRFLGLFMASLLGLLAFNFKEIRGLVKFSFNRSMWRQAMAYGIPSIPHRLSLIVLLSTDRIIMERFCGLDQVGEYSLVSGFALKFGLLVTAINSAWMPRYQRLRSQGEGANRIIQAYNAGWIIFIGCVFILGCFVGMPVFNLLSHGDYAQVSPLIVPLMAGCLLVGLNNLATAPIFYEKRTKFLPIITGSAALVNVIANILIIPEYGAVGAAMTTLFSYMFMLIVGICLGQRNAKVDFAWWRMVLLIFSLLLVLMLVSVWADPEVRMPSVHYLGLWGVVSCLYCACGLLLLLPYTKCLSQLSLAMCFRFLPKLD